MVTPVSFAHTVNRTPISRQPKAMPHHQPASVQTGFAVPKADLYFAGKNATQQAKERATKKIKALEVEQQELERQFADLEKKLKDDSLKAKHPEFRIQKADLRPEISGIKIRINGWNRLIQVLEGKRDINAVDSAMFSRNTLLHDAAHSGDAELTREVLRVGKHLLEEDDVLGNTPLQQAVRTNERVIKDGKVQNSHIDVIQVLLENDANANTSNGRKLGAAKERKYHFGNNMPVSVLEDAERRRFPEIATLLREYNAKKPSPVSEDWEQYEILKPRYEVQLVDGQPQHHEDGTIKLTLLYDRRPDDIKKEEREALKADVFGDKKPAGPLTRQFKPSRANLEPYWSEVAQLLEE